MTWLDVLDELGRENLRLMPRRPSVPWINAVWKVNGPTHRRRPHVKLISVRVTIALRAVLRVEFSVATGIPPLDPTRGRVSPEFSMPCPALARFATGTLQPS